ncbi:hypothetical protein BDN72DRAFT_769613, partial [Pluteus cervinus]
YYQLLAIPRDASTEDIKIAYHRSLLQFHPDKQAGRNANASSSIDITSIKEAYTTLTTPDLRKRYDLSQQLRDTPPVCSRPAQIISLEDFKEVQPVDGSDEISEWHHPCRCGGQYVITVLQMESGQHLVGCTSCSEMVWVGFQLED